MDAHGRLDANLYSTLRRGLTLGLVKGFVTILIVNSQLGLSGRQRADFGKRLASTEADSA